MSVNTPAAEVLYQCVAELADVDKDTIVLDICCGTGTIGLTLAKVNVRRLVYMSEYFLPMCYLHLFEIYV